MPSERKEHIVVLRTEDKETVVRFERDVHTLVLDHERLRKIAIGEFLQKYVKSLDLSKREEKKQADQLIGMAIGYYKIPVNDFYPQLKDIYELDDMMLAAVVRWGHIRETTPREVEDDKAEP